MMAGTSTQIVAGLGSEARKTQMRSPPNTGSGLQHLCLDDIIDFAASDRALVRHHMLMFKREGPHTPNQIWNTGFYYRTVVRTPDGWRFSEIISFVDRKMSDELVTNLRSLVLSRPTILNALSTLLKVDGSSVLNAVKNGTALVSLSGEVSETDVINTVAAAFQRCAPASNPLPSGTARALAYVLTHDQVFGADVEDNFRAAGWNGPPIAIKPVI
jgi:hypothetical protein